MDEAIEKSDLTDEKQESPTEGNTDEVEALKKELAEVQERLKRVAAESDNFRRRQEANFEKRLNSARDDLVSKLLPFIDNLEMAIKAAQESNDVEALRAGVALVHKNVLSILADLGVTPIEAKGKPFDPACHEAVMVEEREDLPDETIADVFTVGYRCGDRVIRPSMVKVARNNK